MHGKRRLNRLAALVAALFAVGTLSVAVDAEARRKGKRRKQTAKVNQRALGELLGDFKLGMTKRQILKVLGKQIGARYKEQIAATADVYKQDQLRRKRSGELNRIKKSYIEFTGKRTSWDVSIVEDQYGHKTGEAMMVYWENKDGKNQRRFFFFHEGRLYKMFIVLNSKMFEGSRRNFASFRQLMQRRYGRGQVQYKSNKDGKKSPTGIVWRGRKYLVKALDRLDFYGSFCLSIAHATTEKRLAELRKSMKKPPRKNRIIDAVLEGKDEKGPGLDENRAATDSILRN